MAQSKNNKKDRVTKTRHDSKINGSASAKTKTSRAKPIIHSEYEGQEFSNAEYENQRSREKYGDITSEYSNKNSRERKNQNQSQYPHQESHYDKKHAYGSDWQKKSRHENEDEDYDYSSGPNKYPETSYNRENQQNQRESTSRYNEGYASGMENRRSPRYQGKQRTGKSDQQWDNEQNIQERYQDTQYRRQQWERDNMPIRSENQNAYKNRKHGAEYDNYENRNSQYNNQQNSYEQQLDYNDQKHYRRHKPNAYGAQNMSNPQYDEFGSQTGNKRVQEGEYGRSRYGYGNDRNQPMDEFISPEANRFDESLRNRNTGRNYRNQRNKNSDSEYGQEGFGSGEMKNEYQKRRQNPYFKEDEGSRGYSEHNREYENYSKSPSRNGKGSQYSNSQNAFGENYREENSAGKKYKGRDTQYGSGSRYEQSSGYGGHGNLYGRGTHYDENYQGEGQGGSQFSGRDTQDARNNTNQRFENRERHSGRDYENNRNSLNRNQNPIGSRNQRHSGRDAGKNEGRTYRQYDDYNESYPEGYDERDEYLDAFRPQKNRNIDSRHLEVDKDDRYNRH